MRQHLIVSLSCTFATILLMSFLSFHDDPQGPDSSIGDVKYSILEPALFLPTHKGWVLLMGQNVDSTKLKDMGIHKLPDARAMFIRGMNVGRSDAFADVDRGRSLLSEQRCAVQKHQHNIIGIFLEAQSGGGFSGYGLESNSKHNEKKYTITDNDPDLQSVETRPNNIPLYIYVKIK